MKSHWRNKKLWRKIKTKHETSTLSFPEEDKARGFVISPVFWLVFFLMRLIWFCREDCDDAQEASSFELDTSQDRAKKLPRDTWQPARRIRTVEWSCLVGGDGDTQGYQGARGRRVLRRNRHQQTTGRWWRRWVVMFLLQAFSWRFVKTQILILFIKRLCSTNF